MARATGFGKRYFKAFMSGFFVAVPVTVTFLDRVAYIARVEGASMQPSLNPPGGTTCDIVLLNRWSVRNYEVQRGDIVSVVSSRFHPKISTNGPNLLPAAYIFCVLSPDLLHHDFQPYSPCQIKEQRPKKSTAQGQAVRPSKPAPTMLPV
ncbi:mitochondrial inner membrane protease subunit 2 isoform X2 [Scyliorhinus canicula]|uniref:mitochondrial inner membrane protease subunit 2 isoform X2 n=1 Tax=Scyliorhinus canicula TaxID=7830 RepID=UPI0018F2800F|nr:mitochondrial inner membrane protease subunit 2 isoform X2 [Scyliorhinus canicula]